MVLGGPGPRDVDAPAQFDRVDADVRALIDVAAPVTLGACHGRTGRGYAAVSLRGGRARPVRDREGGECT